MEQLWKAAERAGFMSLKQLCVAGVCAALTTATLGCGVALAGDRGSMEDQLACTPDVYRLCSSLIPDEDAITACLRQKVNSLSPACHKVFTDPLPAQANQNNDND